MRVGNVADSHYGEHKRFDECVRVHAWIAQDVKQRNLDLFIHEGDVFEGESSELERLAVFEFFREVADVCPVVVIRGNHDRLNELLALAKLDTRHPITVVEDAAVVEVETRAGVALVAAVAWPRKSAVLAMAGTDSHEGGEAIAAELLRNMLRGLGQEMRGHNGPRILAMHAMVVDSMTSTGQPLRGCDFEITLADLALVDASAYFLGHVHLPQGWQIGDAPCLYVGSPRRSDFGELEEKGYTVATFQAGRCTHVEFVKTPCTPMIHLETTWIGPNAATGAPGVMMLDDGRQPTAEELRAVAAGAEVRVRYHVRSHERDSGAVGAAELEAAIMAAGAVYVQTETVVELLEREHAEPIAEDAPLEEQVAAFWVAKGIDPGDRREALNDKLRRLEEKRNAA